MPGQHSPGYLAAHARATRIAAARYRVEHPDEWYTLLAEQRRRRADLDKIQEGPS